MKAYIFYMVIRNNFKTDHTIDNLVWFVSNNPLLANIYYFQLPIIIINII